MYNTIPRTLSAKKGEPQKTPFLGSLVLPTEAVNIDFKHVRACKLVQYNTKDTKRFERRAAERWAFQKAGGSGGASPPPLGSKASLLIKKVRILVRLNNACRLESLIYLKGYHLKLLSIEG